MTSAASAPVIEAFRLVADSHGPAHVIPRGISVLEASAGTGKTWALIHLVMRAWLEDLTIEPTAVLLVTFTNAAADELAERMRALLRTAQSWAAVHQRCAEQATPLPPVPPGDHASAALVAAAVARFGLRVVLLRLEGLVADADRIPVMTIHAWCQRTVDSLARECGALPGAAFLNDDRAVVLDVVHDAWRAVIARDAVLAAVAAEWNGPAADAAVVTTVRQIPGTVVVPDERDLTAALAMLRSALTAVNAALAIPNLAAWMANLTWKKDAAPALQESRHGGPPAPTTDPTTLLSIARQWCLTAIEKALFIKVIKAGTHLHDFPHACQIAVDAAERVRRVWLAWLCPHAESQVQARLAAAGVRTPDGLLKTVAAALHGPQGERVRTTLASRTTLAVIDEFQDTDPLQWQIVNQVFGAQRLVLIGDPKQAIYGFRGGDLPTYLSACAAATVRWRLEVNRRSADDLVTAVNALFAGPRPFVAADPDFHPVRGCGKTLVDGRPPLRWWMPAEPVGNMSAANAAISGWIATEITALIAAGTQWDERPLDAGDCAVLVRSHSQARALRDGLRTRGVLAVLANSGDVLDSPMVAELGVLISAIADPGFGAGRRAALATILVGWDEPLLARLMQAGFTQAGVDPAGSSPSAQSVGNLDEQVVEFLRHAQGVWQRRGPAAALDVVLSTPWPGMAVAPLVRIAGLADGERWLTDVRHALDVIASTAAEAGPAQILALLNADADHRDEEATAARRLQLESDQQAVKIVTMHAAKGLQWPVVFCPYLWTAHVTSRAPIQRVRTIDGPQVVLDGSADERAEYQRRADDVRLAYVALTRAEALCYVAWGGLGQHGSQPAASALGWLLAERSALESTQTFTVTWPGSNAATRHAAYCVSLRAVLAQHSAVMMECPATETHLVATSASAVPPFSTTASFNSIRAIFAANLATWSVASFTSITRGKHQRETIDDAGPATESAALESGSALLGHQSDRDPAAGLARGAAFGVVLHRLLELQDWTQPPDPVHVAAILKDAGLADPHHHHDIDPVPVLTSMITTLAQADLGGWSLSTAQELRREWRFDVPLAALRPAELAGLFSRYGSAAAQASAPFLSGLRGRELSGMLTGSIDLVTLAAGAWWIVDWKSNHLADRAADYHAETCWQAMHSAAYVVQYHLYAVALRRWLRRRDLQHPPLRAAYVFVRGIGAGKGVITDTPAPALLDALEAHLHEGRI